MTIGSARDCLQAGEACTNDPSCSSKFRTLRQCIAGNGANKLGPGAKSHCRNTLTTLLSSQLYGCKCKRGMKKEKHCLSVYWSIHHTLMEGMNVMESSPYEPFVRGFDYVRLASITAGSENEVTQVNRCLDAAKACNVDEMCQRLRTEYVSSCIRRGPRADPCNRSKCHKALRKFFDRVPPESRYAEFQVNCQPSGLLSGTGCQKENYAACLLAYTGIIGSTITPNYIDNSTANIAPWCTCNASGNRQEECERFLHLFTDNLCLRKCCLAERAFDNRTYLSAASSPSTSPTTQMRKQERNTDKVSATHQENILEQLEPTKVSAEEKPLHDASHLGPGASDSALALTLNLWMMVWSCTATSTVLLVAMRVVPPTAIFLLIDFVAREEERNPHPMSWSVNVFLERKSGPSRERVNPEHLQEIPRMC
ncbi:hypothetical protein Chor_001552 [Crotalus horridus]